ncbi:MAG TPA: RNA polymerase factor sigma-54 [Phycisphaerales bacterium]|nr:RNA polymerase factor sigma-54 [Phycisphaerales bacterium]
MRFETSQHMKLGQQMKLAPRMIQSMEILQMPLAELEERIEQELENNPTLELSDGDADDPGVRMELEELRREEAAADRPMSVDEGSAGDDFERLDSFAENNPDAADNEFSASDYGDHDRSELMAEARDAGISLEPGTYSVNRSAGERDAKIDAMAAAPARGASLTEQLRGQWALVDVEGSLRPLGELIITFLEDDGYLRTPLEAIAEKAPVGKPAPGEGGPGALVLKERPTVAQLERALKAVQLFLEPAGVAARTPSECLLLQLDALEDEAEDLGWPRQAFHNARVLVADHLEDLTQNRLPRVAEKTGLRLDEIKEALTLLRRLSLAPARRLVEDTNRAIIPDAIVEYDADQDRYIAYLNDARLPNVRINQEYARLSRDKGMEKKDREFLKTNLGNAQWLLDAVGQRRHTLLRVIRAVVEAQRDFFDFGPQALKPLPMTLVAEQLGIHVATVSRAVAEKHLATPRGVVPLRKFFSGGLHTEGGEDVAWDAIKVALKEVIDGEDKARPLSDEALVDELKKRGIEIARRTVAKYRDQLGIAPARLRKQF